MKKLILGCIVLILCGTTPIDGNIIVNGNFNDGATGWTIASAGDPWTIHSDALFYDSAGLPDGNPAEPSLTKELIEGQSYKIGFTIPNVEGATFQIKLGGSVILVTEASPVSYTAGNYIDAICGSSPNDGFQVLQNSLSLGDEAKLDNFVLLDGGGEALRSSIYSSSISIYGGN